MGEAWELACCGRIRKGDEATAVAMRRPMEGPTVVAMVCFLLDLVGGGASMPAVSADRGGRCVHKGVDGAGVGGCDGGCVEP
jgi:hypothetical protein